MKFAANGPAPNGRVVAFKLVDEGGKLSLAPAWQSRDLTSPLAPIVMNGMVIAVSSGEYRGLPASLSAAQRAQRSVPAVLHILDAATGKTLWSSGTTDHVVRARRAYRRAADRCIWSRTTISCMPLAFRWSTEGRRGSHGRPVHRFRTSSTASGGVLRLEPCWVPRSFMHPGRRLRLHPDDLYAYGAHRGGINERWFSSTTNADNGPGTPAG